MSELKSSPRSGLWSTIPYCFSGKHESNNTVNLLIQNSSSLFHPSPTPDFYPQKQPLVFLAVVPSGMFFHIRIRFMLTFSQCFHFRHYLLTLFYERWGFHSAHTSPLPLPWTQVHLFSPFHLYIQATIVSQTNIRYLMVYNHVNVNKRWAIQCRMIHYVSLQLSVVSNSFFCFICYLHN